MHSGALRISAKQTDVRYKLGTEDNLMCRKMQLALDRYQHELAAVRTGRPSPALLDSVTVDAYGDKQSLLHLATATMRGPRTIGVTVYAKDLTGAVLEAIRTSPLQLNPRQEGGDILVAVPECDLDCWRGFCAHSMSMPPDCRLSRLCSKIRLIHSFDSTWNAVVWSVQAVT